MDDLIAEFIAETNESIAELDNDLVNLEQNPNDKELIGKIFRLIHTVKGTCGFLGLPRLESVAHSGENVLGRFRDGDLEITPEYVTLIFESLDTIRMIVEAIEETGSEPEGDDAELKAKLDAVYRGEGLESAEAAPEPEPEPEVIEKPDEGRLGEATEEELEAAFAAAPGPEDVAPSPAEQTAPEKTTEPEASPAQEQAEDIPPNAEQAEAKAKAATSTQSLRVNVTVLENLMTMVSELVLTRNQLLQILRTQTETEFSAPLQRLNHVVSELQEGVMMTRMQPIGNAWAKLPRIIRDLSIELSKKIDLEMNGQDTELDRQVLEYIKDPLTHMVRNSGDHGIEKPEDRAAAGKSETGKIILNAFHEGGHIIIKISDDGKGLPVDKIKEKILSNGLATSEELAEMSNQQIQQYIFHAGLSTAEAVTSVSGRGVGMDVVKTNIEKIGGSIELKSEVGKGSTFTIKIPLTLAIVSALVVASGGERFAIPQLSVRELVMTSEASDNRIEEIKGAPVLRLRDRLLPLVSLEDLLKLKKYHDDAPLVSEAAEVETEEQKEEQGKAQTKSTIVERRNKYIVVTQIGNYDFGIIVDRVYDTEEIVVKPVAKLLKDIELFSGNTILGDGSVIMILDPSGIARATGEIEKSDSADAAAAEEEAARVAAEQKKTSLLLFRAGDRAPKAVPLSLVARLENIKIEDIETSGDQMMVQYRGGLMPLNLFDKDISLDTEAREKPVLVFSDESRSMGLVVDEIIDITEEVIDVQVSTNARGVIGSAIINGKATEVMDVMHFLEESKHNWFNAGEQEAFASNGDANGHAKRRILLVDDSPFFRNMLTPLLNVAGYHVTTSESPAEALKRQEEGETFDVIVSDIEMPEMNGFEFAEKIKAANSNWQNIPLVALSSHATPQDIDKGMEVGFNKYVAKFDKETLLDTLSQTLSEPTRAQAGDMQ